MTGKTLFQAVIESSVWRLPSDTRVVWITLLAMADSDGLVLNGVCEIAARASVPEHVCREALTQLASPDPQSRVGRRIQEYPDGFRVLDYERYFVLVSEARKQGHAVAAVDHWEGLLLGYLPPKMKEVLPYWVETIGLERVSHAMDILAGVCSKKDLGTVDRCKYLTATMRNFRDGVSPNWAKRRSANVSGKDRA